MTMTISTHLSPLVALIVGILILILPRFLNGCLVNFRPAVPVYMTRGAPAGGMTALSQILLRRSGRGSCPCLWGDYAPRE
jgi:hypothetical protein